MPLRRKNVSAEVGKFGDHEVLLQVRTRFLPADLVTVPGIVLLPAISRGRYRMVDCSAIANGGAAAGITSIAVSGVVLGTRVNIVVMAAAGLTQSTLLRAGAANSTILANGASFGLADAGSSINVERIGGGLTGATSIDIFLSYVLELNTLGS